MTPQTDTIGCPVHGYYLRNPATCGRPATGATKTAFMAFTMATGAQKWATMAASTMATAMADMAMAAAGGKVVISCTTQPCPISTGAGYTILM